MIFFDPSALIQLRVESEHLGHKTDTAFRYSPPTAGFETTSVHVLIHPHQPLIQAIIGFIGLRQLSEELSFYTLDLLWTTTKAPLFHHPLVVL